MFKMCKLLPKVPLEDLKSLSGMLVKAMEIRERYMRFSHQKFPGFVNVFNSDWSALNFVHLDGCFAIVQCVDTWWFLEH